jgi:PHD/YefM family antitoxin component YafN of YafNO toxin-antitoxin module
MVVNVLEISAREVRLPARAIEALAEHRPVAVTRYGRRQHVLLSEEQFSLVAPLLEVLQDGTAISPEMLMTSEDIELLRDLDEDLEPTPEEEAQIAQLLAEADAQ